MGLWVVKQLVDKYGRAIDLESTVGQGPRFTLTWPREFPAPPGFQEVVASAASVIPNP